MCVLFSKLICATKAESGQGFFQTGASMAMRSPPKG